MLELFRDPAWEFAGVVVGLLAALFIYWLQKQKKSLSYEIISRNQLLTFGEELEGKLQVSYEGQPTKGICILIIKLFNSGNLPVTASDYERPISFGTGDKSRILSAVVTGKEPDALSVEVSAEKSRVEVRPLLLNAKDSVTLKLLVSDFHGEINVDARVVGVKAITKSGRNSGQLLAFSGAILLGFGIAFILINS